MRKTLFALVDCSSFYCSCERVFRADLKDKPICVLSNNDGCIISLTHETKEMGFKMGTPYYQVKDELRSKGVSVFSSNYCLYDDMSRRVVKAIRSFSDLVEQYSIDEAFVQLDVDLNDRESEKIRMQTLAEDIHKTILKKTGMPVRVSIAETKTLAKIGSEYTKDLMKEGVVPAICFWDHPNKKNVIEKLEVSKIWGIGRQWSKKLNSLGIYTASQLAQSNPELLRKLFNLVMEKIIFELQGVPSIDFESVAPIRKSLVRSRMFSKKINNKNLLGQAIAFHLSRAAEKLRHDRLMATELSVFISTSKHSEIKKVGHAYQNLLRPTNDTLVLSSIASKLFDQCYTQFDKSGNEFKYSKAGVALGGLVAENIHSIPLFDIGPKENPVLMQTIDSINKRFGKYALVQMSVGLPNKLCGLKSGSRDSVPWVMKRGLMSKRFTTAWEELLIVKIK